MSKKSLVSEFSKPGNSNVKKTLARQSEIHKNSESFRSYLKDFAEGGGDEDSSQNVQSDYLNGLPPGDEEQLRKIDKYKRKINERLLEIIQNEHIYVAKLQSVEKYYNELIGCELRLKEEEIGDAQEEIFYKVFEMFHFHKKLLKELESSKDDLTSMMDVFVKNEKSFEMYIDYNTLLKTNEKFITQRKKFDDGVVYAGILNPLNNISEPNTRLSSYLVSLSEILSYSEKYENEMRRLKLKPTKDSGDIQAAIDSIKLILNKKRISKILSSIVNCPLDLNYQGMLLRHDKFHVTDGLIKSQVMVCTLLTNALLLSIEDKTESKKVLKYFDLMTIDDLGITVKGTKTFSIWYRSKNITPYNLKGDEPTVKDWVDIINQLIHDQISSHKGNTRKKAEKNNSVFNIKRKSTGVKESSEASMFKTLFSSFRKPKSKSVSY